MKLPSIRHVALALFVLAVPATAKHKPAPPPSAPRHNFVNLDLSAPGAAASSRMRFAITLIDAATAVRRGDMVDFDVLTISKSFGHYMSGATEVGPPEGTVMNALDHQQASCAWRTLRVTSNGPNHFGAGKSFGGGMTPDAAQDRFLDARSPLLTVIDKLCEGVPLNPGQGYASADAAVAASASAFGPPSLPPPPAVMRPAPPATPAGWMDGPHRFVRIETDTASGNTRFLDRGDLVRDGQIVTTRIFVLLGPQAQYWTHNGVGIAALQSVRIDCAAHTLTVTAQVEWDRLGALTRRDETAYAPRTAGARAQIDAACADPAPADGQSFASTDDAWDFVRASWPPAPLPGWLACIWAHEPAGRRQAFLAQFSLTSFPRYLVPRPEADTEAAVCAIPTAYSDTAFDHLTGYANTRAALQTLAARGIDEDKIRAAWNALPAADRQRMLRFESTFGSTDTAFAHDMLDRIAAALHVSSADTDTRGLLQRYLIDQAFVEAC